MTCALHQREESGIVTFTLENEHVRVVLMPECGAKVRHLVDKLTGHDWMLQNPYLPVRVPRGSTRYVAEFDNGGWDECFPTIAPGIVQKGAFKGKAVHDHGELWSQEWKVVEALADTKRATVSLQVELEEIPVRVTRRTTLHSGSRSLVFEYEMTNLSGDAIDYTWAVHPLFALEEGMRVESPPGCRCVSGKREAIGGHTLGLDAEGVHALPDPRPPGERGFQYKVTFVGDFTRPIVLRRGDGSGFGFRFGAEDFDGVALWVNAGAWSGCGSVPYNNLGFEPQVGLSDDLAAAQLAGGPLARLEARAKRRWSLEVILMPGSGT